MMTPTLWERQEHERTHILNRSWCRHCVAARASNPAHRGRRFATTVEEDTDMKQNEFRLLLHAKSAVVDISKDPGVKRPRYPHGVSSSGTNERNG